MTRANPREYLYRGALHHVAHWDAGRLEARSAVAHSSQALCISVFGALDGHPRGPVIVRAICAAAGLEAPEGAPRIECEVRSHPELLGEIGGRNPTSPDVLIEWPEVVLVVESKFRERLGGCSQAKPPRQRQHEPNQLAACTGNHEPGSDRRTKTGAACRLTIQDGERTPRRYWEIGARLFQPEVLATPRRPCPFRDGHYQLMRNLCFAAAYADWRALPDFGLVVAYVSGARSARHTEDEIGAFQTGLLPDVRRRFGAVTYEQVGEIVRGAGESELADWLEARLAAGLASA